jgi:aldehyde dehydrogenase
MRYAAESLIPSTTELGGKSPNIFFADVMAQDDAFLDKAIEGLVLYAFNKGEVCTCPSRAIIHEEIYEPFMARCLERIAAIRQGDPLDPATQVGPQVSTGQRETIERYVQIGRDEGAEVLIGGSRPELGDELDGGSFYEPTVFKGTNDMRIFQEEIFGPVLPRRRRLDPRRQPRLPRRPRDPGRARVDQLLPPVPRRCGVRRVQGLRHRAREPPHDARPLLPDQVLAGQLRRRADGALLGRRGRQ